MSGHRHNSPVHYDDGRQSVTAVFGFHQDSDPHALHAPVLVLNASYEPINICAARRAIVRTAKEHRGRGIGTEAQRQLVTYLFATMPVHRLEAATDVENVAEQRALEKAGFRREGVRRGITFRGGAWRDDVLYGMTREDL